MPFGRMYGCKRAYFTVFYSSFPSDVTNEVCCTHWVFMIVLSDMYTSGGLSICIHGKSHLRGYSMYGDVPRRFVRATHGPRCPAMK